MKYRQLTDDERTRFVDDENSRAFASCVRPIVGAAKQTAKPVVVTVKRKRRQREVAA